MLKHESYFVKVQQDWEKIKVFIEGFKQMIKCTRLKLKK